MMWNPFLLDMTVIPPNLAALQCLISSEKCASTYSQMKNFYL